MVRMPPWVLSQESRSRVPEAGEASSCPFLHSVLLVAVQFLTITSSFLHLVWGKKKGKDEGLQMGAFALGTNVSD